MREDRDTYSVPEPTSVADFASAASTMGGFAIQQRLEEARRIPNLRMEVANLEIETDEAQRRYTMAVALAEEAAYLRAGDAKTLGSNEAERKLRLELVVMRDLTCQDRLNLLTSLQSKLRIAKASLEWALDMRRERENTVRERYVAALENGPLITHITPGLLPCP